MAIRLSKDQTQKLIENHKDETSYKWMSFASKYYGVSSSKVIGPNEEFKNDACVLQFFAGTLGQSFKLKQDARNKNINSVSEINPDTSKTVDCFALGENQNGKLYFEKNKRAISDLTAWCSAFANFVMKSTGFPTLDKLAANSWKEWGVVLSPFDPPFGAIIILHRPGGESWNRHVGFYCGENKTHYFVLGGNQGFGSFGVSSVNIMHFSKKTMPLDQLRWPKGAVIPNLNYVEWIEL